GPGTGRLPDWSIEDIAVTPGEYGGRGVSYAISGVKGVIDWANWARQASIDARWSGVPHVPYITIPTFSIEGKDGSLPEPIEARARREYQELAGWQRFLLEAVADP